MKKRFALFFLCLLGAVVGVRAQLSSNPDKFLGNITTSYNIDAEGCSEKFYQLWNEITPENETKWASIEGNRGSFNWGAADRINSYANQHNFPFKFHTLVWGSQFPGWVKNLSVTDRYDAIVKWMDAVKQRYPNLQLIDVVNEAIDGHQPDTHYISEALGGPGKTGYDWIIKAFELAYERWPNAILIYNDFNTFQWNTDQFIDLVRTVRNAGAPIDAYGCQSHDLTDCNVTNFKNSMTKIQNALKMPMYSTEYDIGTDDDNLQLQRYQEQIPYMWEADYCAGVTLWGYIYGKTWTTNGNSGIIKNGEDRPAMTWLRQYMQTDAAKSAKSPFPGMKKEASVYVKPATISPTQGDVLPIEVRARLATKTIEKVELYVKNQLFCTMTEAPYTTEYTVQTLGTHTMKAVVYATDGTKYERQSAFTSYKPRAPYKGVIALPGTIQAENFDSGADGISYHDSDSQNQGTGASYRSDAGGVDIESISGGYAVGYTRAGEWLEYTVNVTEPGFYEYDVYCSSQDGGGAFSLALSGENGLTGLTGVVPVVKTGNWSTYKAIHGRLNRELAEGQQVLRFIVETGTNLFNIDRIVLRRVDVDEQISISMTADPAPAVINENTTLTVSASSPTSTIANVKIYANQMLMKTLTAEPFTAVYKPATKGTVDFMAVATDAEGRLSKTVNYVLTVNNKRIPYKNVSLPGTVQFEDFDKGGEGFTFHDSDAEDQGKANYRADNEGVDIMAGNGGYVIGYTVANEWLEYTVNVTKAGTYYCEAYVSSGTTGAAFSVSLMDNGQSTQLCRISIPKTGDNNWDTYKKVKVKMSKPLEVGQHTLRVRITGANGNLDRMVLSHEDGDDAPAGDPNFHVYLCFGQSNMEGNAQWESIDNQYVDPRFQMLATTDFTSPQRTMGEWYTALCPIVSPKGKLGMSDYFGRTMVAAMPSSVKVGVVAVAMGGSPIEMFDKDKYEQKLAENPNEWWATLAKQYYGGNPYGRLIEMAKKAQQKGVIKGILLHQGCSNCGDPNWPNMVKKIYNDILDDLGLEAENVPLYAGETEQADMGGGCAGHNVVVNQLPDVIPTAHVVHSNGIPGNGQDAWHFSAAGYRTFGKRYAIEALKVMGRKAQKDASYSLPSNLVNFYTLTSLEASTQQVRVGATQRLTLWGTFADGHREDLSNEALFSAGNGLVVANGSVTAAEEGTYTVTATYTDFLGTAHTAQLVIEAVGTGIASRFTDLSAIGLQPFAIVNEQVAKAFYCPDNQNLVFDAYEKAFADNVVGYCFQLESLAGNADASIRNCYFLRLIKLDGTPYTIWGSPGYLNSQPVDKWCSFILGLNNQNGEDMKNGAVWDISYVEGKGFTLKNVGTGKYLQDAAPAKYDAPSYFTFCTIGASPSGIAVMDAPKNVDGTVTFDLNGRRVDLRTAHPGIYIRGGKKVIVR